MTSTRERFFVRVTLSRVTQKAPLSTNREHSEAPRATPMGSSRAPDMVVVTSAYGSEGDILPLLALARACRDAAPAETRVVFVSNPKFEPPEARPFRDRTPGSLEFVGVGSRQAYDAMLADSRDARRKDKSALARFWVSHLDEHFSKLRTLTTSSDEANEKTTVVVTHALDLAARCFDEWIRWQKNKPNVTCVTAVLSPFMLRCDDVRAPVLDAVFGECLGSALSRHAPKRTWRVYDAAVDFFYQRGVDAFRKKIRKKFSDAVAEPRKKKTKDIAFEPARGIYRDWFLCSGGVLAMWPPWFGPPHPQWPKNVKQVGFPGDLIPDVDEDDDARRKAALPAPFLRDAQNAEKDVWVFMVGSGNPPHARAFFEAAVRAASEAEVRAVLLTRHADAVPVCLPEKKNASASRKPRAPFTHVERCDLRALLSHDACAGVVHGGGVGTTAVALACGVAQIVVPSGWDQHDNARRAKRLAGEKCEEISLRAFRDSPRRVARLMRQTTKGFTPINDKDADELVINASNARSWGGARRAAAHVLAPNAFGV